MKDIIPAVLELDLRDLEVLQSTVEGLIQKQANQRLSTDEISDDDAGENEGPGLNDWAKKILEDERAYEITLADQALLASVILKDGYRQEVFSSRDINDVIEECGRPRVAHITSALSSLTGRSFLSGGTKELSLSKEGHAKARGLIGMLTRRQLRSVS